MMYGAIIGDIVGSIFEFDNIKTKEFPFFSEQCEFTDDSVMTIAIASALIQSRKHGKLFSQAAIEEMQRLGRLYPHAGYGARFRKWLETKDPQPYNSFGNGSAMRVSPCALIARSFEEALALAEVSALITHNHEEGIKGAVATAAAIWMARNGQSKTEIKNFICEHYYTITLTLDEIRPNYFFDETCPGSVPQAIVAFLESNSYEDAIRNAVSIGGDSDTIAAIAGSIAWPYYWKNNPEQHQPMLELKDKVYAFLPDAFSSVIKDFEQIIRSE